MWQSPWQSVSGGSHSRAEARSTPRQSCDTDRPSGASSSRSAATNATIRSDDAFEHVKSSRRFESWKRDTSMLPKRQPFPQSSAGTKSSPVPECSLTERMAPHVVADQPLSDLLKHECHPAAAGGRQPAQVAIQTRARPELGVQLRRQRCFRPPLVRAPSGNSGVETGQVIVTAAAFHPFCVCWRH